jgi:hypothetical protein
MADTVTEKCESVLSRDIYHASCQRSKGHKGPHKHSFVFENQRITIHWHNIQ